MLRTKSLRVGIQIRRSRRQLHRLHPGISYHLQKLSGEQRITIVNLVSLSRQDSLLRIREIARDLAHPQSIRATRDPRNLDLQCGEFHEKQNDKSLQPSPGPHFQGEEVRGYDQLPMLA